MNMLPKCAYSVWCVCCVFELAEADDDDAKQDIISSLFFLFWRRRRSVLSATPTAWPGDVHRKVFRAVWCVRGLGLDGLW